MPEAEAKLWSRLRAARLDGIKVRRQAVIGPYIVDFVVPACRLVIELDGSQHADQTDYDARRTALLEREGYRVLRFWNGEVMRSLEEVLRVIHAEVRQPLSPLAQGRESTLSPEGRG